MPSEQSAGTSRPSVSSLDPYAAAELAAQRIKQSNIERGDSFQDYAMAEIRNALDSIHAAEQSVAHMGSGQLAPEREGADPRGQEPLERSLLELARELDASQETIALHCERVLAIAREGA